MTQHPCLATQRVSDITAGAGRRRWTKWLLRLIGVAALVLIVLRVGRQALWAELRTANWSLVLLAAVLCAVHFGLKAVRWNYILRRSAVAVSQRETLGVYCAGALLGIVTPGRVGEFAKAAYIRNWSAETSWGTALGTVVLDRLVDLGAFALVALWGVVWVGLPGQYRIVGEVAIMVLLAIGFTGSLLVWRRLYYSTFGERVRGLVRQKIGASAGDFYGVLKLGKGAQALPVVGWTAGAYILFFLHFLCLSRAMGSTLSFGILCWGIALASLGALLPISISGIGVRDFILIAVFTSWGETPARTLAISLTYLTLLYVVVTLIGIWRLLRGDIDIRQILRKGKIPG
ncbi:MAG: flippase-like domain-containing protein [Phycisphaerae bacterium]|nr:flippase-like domain-containing protein [Phycisphaerae bacterium]